MKKDDLYWKAFWTFFCGLGMVFCFTMLPFVVYRIGMDKLQGALIDFVGVAVLMLTVIAALISFLLVQVEGSDTNNENLRAMRLQRLTNVGRICIKFVNPVGFGVVSFLFLRETVLIPFYEAIGLARSNLGLGKDSPE